MPPRHAPFVLALIAAVAMFALIAACSSDNGDGGKVVVTMTETSLKVDPNAVPKGPVEIEIKNEGKEQHSLLIIKTNLPPDQLPTKTDGSVDTGGADVDVKHEIDEIDNGDDTSRTYQLDPGTYVLISNKVRDGDNDSKIADYEQGMRATITVTEGSVSASASTAATPTKAASATATR